MDINNNQETNNQGTGNKRLYRSKKDSKLAGVCGGLAEYFNIDPVLVRLIFVLLSIYVNSGLIAYIIMAIIIPENPNQ